MSTLRRVVLQALSYLALAGAGISVGCDSQADTGESALTSAITIAHSWDFKAQVPAHLAIMYSMSWFGLESSDPQIKGTDPSYGNFQWGGGKIATNDPKTCTTCVLEGADDKCLETGAPQRAIASRRKMLAGMYSASAIDADGEGKRRTDLMLSQLRGSCGDGAKLDAWSVQLAGTHAGPLHPGNPQSKVPFITYHALVAFLTEARDAGMDNVILPGDDATWYFGFGNDVGLGKCDDKPSTVNGKTVQNPKSNCIDALTEDIEDMVTMSADYSSALKLGGKPVITVYFRSTDLTAAQWVNLLQTARNKLGKDFYVIAMTQSPSHTEYFEAFDAIMPWLQQGSAWTSTVGKSTTVREHAVNWTASLHDALITAVNSGKYPGRMVFGGVTPGFDDYTMQWGDNVERQLPTGDPRDPQLMLGEFDYFRANGIKHVIGETWDDWTEGSHFEPDVAGKAALLVELRQQLGNLLGEAPDPAGDTRLANQWASYGQVLDCSGKPAGTPPVTKLSCDAASCAADRFALTSNASYGGWDADNIDLVADVNGDGKSDLVVLWNNAGTTEAAVSTSNGSAFDQVSSQPVGAWAATTRNLIGDIDHDGNADLVRVYQHGTQTFAAVYRSNGSELEPVSNAAVGGWDPSYRDLLIDVDGDGRADLVVLWNNGGELTAQVALSNGTGFAQVSNASLGVAWSTADRVLVGDVDGDGKADLIRIHQTGANAYAQVFRSVGSAFTAVSDGLVGGWNAANVELVGDFDADGKADLLVVWANGNATTAQLARSTGTAFATVSNNAIGVTWNPANRYLVADTDGDKRADLVTLWADGASERAQIATSTGTAFTATSNAAVGGANAANLDVLADVSGDGKADLVVLWDDATQPPAASARAQVTLSTCE